MLSEGKIHIFNDAEKCLKYLTENDYVCLSAVDPNQPSEIKLFGYTLKLDEGAVLGTHYWNRYNMTDEIEIDISVSKRTGLPTIRIVTDPPMDATTWVRYDLKNKTTITDSDGNIKMKENSNIKTKDFEKIKQYLIKWNNE